jgi:threonine aldolase
MQFASDNWAGAAPPIVEAMAEEAARADRAYGGSEREAAAAAIFAEVFEREVAVFFVATGSAANGLAFSPLARPGGAILCHRESHILKEEFGGVELLAGGARPVGVDGGLGRMDADALAAALAEFPPDSLRGGQPIALSITQQTEAGTAYPLAEITALTRLAAARGLPVHMDGARFANALVALGLAPAEMSWKAGIDLLSFGGTKNGTLGADALLVFDPALARDLPFAQKRAGHLFSKSRLIAAQFDAYLRDGLWLDLARHANGMADLLRAGLARSPHARAAWPTTGNQVFAVLRRSDVERLRAAGGVFYEWPAVHGADPRLQPDETIVRLVTSFSTHAAEAERFVTEIGG